jgi:hypothetical protein
MPESPATPCSLAQTLAHIRALDENLVADVGALEPGWFCAADLIQPHSVTLTAALERQAADYPQMPTRTKGSYLIGEYAWYVAASAIAAYLAEQRVPDFSPENIGLRFQRYTWHEGEHSGEADRIEVRFLTDRFMGLPQD